MNNKFITTSSWNYGREMGVTESSVKPKRSPALQVVNGSSFNEDGVAMRKNSASSNTSDVCRDFLRNVCHRGNRCRFSHSRPDGNLTFSDVPATLEDPFVKDVRSGDQCAQGTVMKSQRGLQDVFVFCHDYQNKQECPRANCKYIHCSREEEDEYHMSGYLPPRIREQAMKKAVAPDMPANFGSTPICKDFLKGDCRRSSCKFRHVTPTQYDKEMSHCNERSRTNGNRSRGASDESNWTSFGEKRRRLDANGDDQNKADGERDCEKNSELEMLRQENLLLTQRVEQLKKQVHDLSTTNDFLLEQNAQLRIGVKASAATTAMPLVSMSMHQPPAPAPTATIAMATLEPGGPPATVSLQPVSAAVMSCCHAAEIGAHQPSQPQPQPAPPPPQPQPQAPQPQPQPPPSSATAVHMQETRLVTFPITSIRQGM